MPVIGGPSVGGGFGAPGAPAAYLAPSGGDDTAALQNILYSNTGEHRTVRLSGIYKTSAKLIVNGNLDASDAEIQFTGSGVALQIGPGGEGVRIFRYRIALPRVVLTTKVNGSWAPGGVGVLVVNCYSCAIAVSRIRGFETGLLVYGEGTGCVYNTFSGGHLDNNKINCRADCNATGWSNENKYIGIRHSHESGEGTEVPGTRHIYLAEQINTVNNNSWIGCSLETPSVVEEVLECRGPYNYFLFCRWESSTYPAKVRWGTIGKHCVIFHGNQADRIVQINEPGSGPNMIQHSAGASWQVGNHQGGGRANVVENQSSSASPFFTMMSAGAQVAGANPLTEWRAQLAANSFAFKAAADVEPRLRIDSATGRLYMGPGGTTAPTSYLYPTATGFGIAGSLVCSADNTFDIGAAGGRPKRVLAATSINPPPFSTAQRPLPATVGIGGMVWDSNLKKPIWSDGTAWLDSTGTVV